MIFGGSVIFVIFELSLLCMCDESSLVIIVLSSVFY